MSVIYEASGNWQTTQVMLALEHFTKWPWCRAPSVFKCLKWPFKCMELIPHEDAQMYCTSQWFSLGSVSFSASRVSVTITFYVTPPKPCQLSNIVEQLWCFLGMAFQAKCPHTLFNYAGPKRDVGMVCDYPGSVSYRFICYQNGR